MAEYAATYGGLPAPQTLWFDLLALVWRASRFEARARLRLMDSVAAGIATVFDGPQGSRGDLLRLAYPGHPEAREPMVNLARAPQPEEEPTDG